MPATPSPTQTAAITAPLGSTLVVAGPGAGKTFCLIGRVGHLIGEFGLAPERILALTFTNKAAEEIATRLADTLGAAASAVHRGTIHALTAELLREHGPALGIEQGFGIADDDYQYTVLRRLGVWNKRISRLLARFGRRRLEGYELTGKDEKLFQRYVAHLRRRNLLDFDDLITSTHDLLTGDSDVAKTIAAKWDYLLVDEGQDLTPAQYEIVKALGWEHRNVFVVGDDEQSIFSWTGADPTVLKRFATEFGIVRPIILDKNRRCSVEIFETARRLLQGNVPLFRDKAIVAERAADCPVTAHAFPNDDAELKWLVADIARAKAAAGGNWGDVAVLYRLHRTGNRIEGALIEAGIPCRLARGRSLKDDPVIRYVLAAVSLMRHPNDDYRVEQLAELVLPQPLMTEVRDVVRRTDRDFRTSATMIARGKPKRDDGARKLWRFVYEVQNLEALPRIHDDLMAIVEQVLSRRVGNYRNVLEEHHHDMADPADMPEVVRLAGQLRAAMDGRRRVLLESRHGLEIAERHLLLQGGVTDVAYKERKPREHELSLETDALTLFKALQLVHTDQAPSGFSDYVAFDLETTDADVDSCEIVEIGAVRVRSGVVVQEFHRLVKPDRGIDPRASKKSHGLTAADLEDTPAFAQVWPAFRDFVSDDLVLAHNALNFDVPVLERMVHSLGDIEEVTRYAQLVFYDTLPLARALVSGSAALDRIAVSFGIDPGRSHRALDDSITLAAVFGKLQELEAARLRKTALVNLLDWVAIGLALEILSGAQHDEERKLLLEAARVRALGPYSDALEQYEGARALIGDDSIPTPDALIEALGGRRLMQRLRKEKTAEQRYPEAVARIAAVVEASRADTLENTIDRFLERITLTTSQGADVARGRVNLLTLHSTKGLEFPSVYIVGVEDEEFVRSTDGAPVPDNEMEEARRLLYVGMTRAEDRLVLTWSARRDGWSRSGRQFLDETGVEVSGSGDSR
jgi:DNA polymerase III epsilon subunit family exonuclease